MENPCKSCDFAKECDLAMWRECLESGELKEFDEIETAVEMIMEGDEVERI